jgi:UMF1 family MFS transporter
MQPPPLASGGAAGVPRRQILAWCLYDFANSAYTTLVVTFVYSTYFIKSIPGGEVRGTHLWSLAVSGSAIAIAILSPLLGAIADASGRRRSLLTALTLGCVGGTALLTFCGPERWLIALAIFGVANVAYEIAEALYNAYLPEISTPATIGRISGYGWGLGYVGGLLALVVAFTMTGLPDGQGGWTLRPWLATEGGWNIRATNLLVAAWYLAFALPVLLLVPVRQRGDGTSLRRAARGSFARIAAAFREVRKFRQAARLLVARLIYNDGLVTVFAFGGIYAAGTFGMSFGEVVLLGIGLNVAAGLGALCFGHVDDRLGGKVTIMVTLVALIAASGLGAVAPSRQVFWIAALGIGLMVGPNQAASRSLLGRFAPAGRQAEFFGFFAFSGKATSFLGPLLLGQVTAWTGNQRWGMASVVLFFAVGLLVLLAIDERAGVAAARA